MIIWGGGDNSGDLVSGGCYNPLTNTWAPTSTGSGCPSPRNFYTAVWTGTEMIIWGGHAASGGFLNTGGRYSPLTDTWTATSTNVSCPAAREQHSAVWTGSVMVIWGGISGSTYANTGGRYDPLTDQWQSTTLSGAPTGRAGALAVWTGSVMVVWGGGGYSNYVTGGCYDPVANSWASTSTYAAPSGRSNASVVWTGSEMIVWGGIKTGVLGDGGRYNPQSDTWTAIPAGGGAPAARCDHEAVWTGSEMIIWGGVIDWLNNQTVNTGGCYDPETGTWTPTSTGPTTCALRNDDTSIWTGAELIVWGGYNGAILSSGGRYYPSTDAWTPTSQGSGCPSGREKHVAVWTGSRMLIWSGSDVASNYADGSSYDPDSDSWTPLPTSLNTPSRRSEAAAVWTGAEMLVWGGWRGPDYLNSGGRYNPENETWMPISDTGACPTGRAYPLTVWTGSNMIVWGGFGAGGAVNTGGRYNPSADSWTATSTLGDCPEGRYQSTGLWTDTEFLVWGGRTYSGTLLNSGARYDPASDSWTAISTGTNCPTARYGHTAVWSGREMIIWGGHTSPGDTNSGARYDPETDTWIPTVIDAFTPPPACGHVAVWMVDRMFLWGGSSERIAFYSPGQIPSGVSPPVLQDLDSCGGGVQVTWDADPGDWHDLGSGNRSYRIYRDGLPLSSGGCSGEMSYGTTTCTDYTATAGRSYQYQVTYKNGCSGFAASSVATIVDKGIAPTVVGPAIACTGAPALLQTQSFDTYQWIKDSADIPGATGSSFVADTTGAYAVRVSKDACTAVSPLWAVTFHSIVSPVISGNSSGCLSPGVSLSTGSYSVYQWMKGGVDMPGQTYSSCNVNESGSYQVRVANSFGCITTSSPKSVTIYPSPSPVISSASSGCASPGVILSTGSFSSYQWLFNGSSISGATSPTYTATQAGSYYVTVTNEYGCRSTSPYRYVDIYDNPLPVVNGPATGCSGVPVTLSTTIYYASYQWSLDGSDIPEATSVSLSVTQSGSYTVRVTDNYGCEGTSSAKVVTINDTPAPVVNGPTDACAGTAATLSTSAFSSYQWILNGTNISGANGQTYSASQSGSYSVVVTNSSGCSGTSSDLTLTVHALPMPTVVGQSKNACGSIIVPLSTQAFSSYQWTLDGSPIQGATGQSFDAAQSGTYGVTSTDTYGCEGSSPSFDVTIQDCTDEDSPPGAAFPARLVRDGNSSTGYYLYFSKISYAVGYAYYEGSVSALTSGSYDHGTGSHCDIPVIDLGTGEMRTEIAPSSGDHYYLVTAHSVTLEGPSGFETGGQERDPAQNTCSP